MTLVLDSLTARLGEFVLGPVTHQFGSGVTAILGPNGSGKSSLMKSMLGVVPGATGTARWNDLDLRARHLESFREVSFIPDGSERMLPEFSASEHVRFLTCVRARSFGDDPDELYARAAEIAERLSLDLLDGTRVADYSLGMSKKLQLVCGLMTQPRLLIVDEPQIGLDFFASQALVQILHEVCEQRDATVLMSNHDLDSVARASHHIVVLKAGQMVATDVLSSGSGESLEASLRSALEGS